MKKMKRFLSLLICMVMLMSVLPMSAAAAPHYGSHQHNWWTNHGARGHQSTCWCGELLGDVIPHEYNNWFLENKNLCYCGYEKQTYSITYKDDDKVLADLTPSSYTDGRTENIPLPDADDVTKTGYTFVGWYTNKGLTEGPVTVIRTNAYGDKIFYAKWEALPTYAVAFDTNGSTDSFEDATTGTNGKLATLPTPSRGEHYTFDGWFTEKNGGDKVTTDTVFSTNSTVYAHWTPVNYTITYEGAEGVDNPTSYNIESGEITLINPSKEGHKFLGWTGTGLDAATENVTIPTGSSGNRTYTAHWEALPTYTITFDGNGGEPTAATGTTGTDGKLATLPSANLADYDFVGWFTEKNGGDKVTTDTVFSTNSTVYAHWTPVNYTITYEGAEGVDNPTSYNIESGEITLINPSKEGHKFLGWTGTGLDAATENVTIPTGSSGNRTYTAHWERVVTHTVKFWTLGQLLDTKYVVHGETVSADGVVPAGYKVPQKWYYWGTNVEHKFNYPVNQDLNLYAQLEVENYDISYDLAGGAVAGRQNPETYNIYSQTITLKNPTKAGYTFAGWIGTGLDAATENVTIPTGSTGERSYTATWTAIEYPISYNLAGGTVATANPATYTIESDPIELNNPTKAGYTFAGWTGTGLDAATESVTIPAGSTGERTYTATWTPITYTISYKLNGGALATGVTNPTTYTAADEITLKKPTKAGYTFAGWTGTGLTEATVDVDIPVGSTGIRSYEATWTKDCYTVVFHGNGGVRLTRSADDTAEQVINTGEAANLMPNPFVREGYGFTGWNTDPKGSGTSYADKQLIDEDLADNGETIDLYAQWGLNSYTVTFDTNGKGTAPTAQTVGYGNKAAKPADPTAANYTFGGWYTDKECTYEYSFETPVTGDITLYAKWTKTIYKVTYDANGGTGEMPVVNVEAGEGHTLVANEFKAPAGKTFKCWKIGLKEYKAGEKIDVTENVTVKAVWKNKTASSDLDYVPAAGDNFPTLLWAGLLLFSVVALVEVVVLRRKRS